MIRLVAGELIKVRTTRTAFGFGLAALVLALATVLVSTLAADPETIRDKRGALAFGAILSILLLIYGVVGATGEFRHRTLAPAVLIAPDRFRLVAARTLAYALTAGALGLAIGGLVFLVGVPLLAQEAGQGLETSDYVGLFSGGLVAAMLCAALGVGVGTLIRNQVAAVVGLFLWIFVAEPLATVINENLTDYTIGVSFGAVAEAGNAESAMLPAVLVLSAWTAVLFLAGALVDRRRDVD